MTTVGCNLKQYSKYKWVNNRGLCTTIIRASRLFLPHNDILKTSGVPLPRPWLTLNAQNVSPFERLDSILRLRVILAEDDQHHDREDSSSSFPPGGGAAGSCPSANLSERGRQRRSALKRSESRRLCSFSVRFRQQQQRRAMPRACFETKRAIVNEAVGMPGGGRKAIHRPRRKYCTAPTRSIPRGLVLLIL